MATEIQGWQLDRIRAAAVEVADFFPVGHNDREIRAIAERALAGADRAVPIYRIDPSPLGDSIYDEAYHLNVEVERLRKIERAARNVLTFLPLDGGFDEMVALRAALTPSAEPQIRTENGTDLSMANPAADESERI